MITTDRDVYLAAHVTQIVKDQLKEEAKKKDLSVSMLIFEISKEYLRSVGYNPEQPVLEQEERLPFETSDPTLQRTGSEPVGHPGK